MIQPQALIKGRYRVAERLGEGGMAIVYLGRDLQLGREVAIKTLRPQYAADATVRVRFEREARAAAALSHPNIIDVYDVGEERGTPYLVMELVRGQALRDIIASEAPFHPDDVAQLLDQVGSALDYAHARGYVHRDIKPGNILIDDLRRARVVDFGIAKGLADSNLTETGAGWGTAGYISPEQAEGLMATPASDVYSLVVVAYEMLTGQLPFRAETPLGVAMQHVNDAPPAPSHLVTTVPPQVDAVILRGLDKDPTRRWSSAGAFARAMRLWRTIEGPRNSSPSTIVEPPPEAASVVPTMIVALLVLGALAALLWTGFRGLPGTGQTPSPTVPVPAAPVITGGLDPDDPSLVGDAVEHPTQANSVTPPMATQPVEIGPAPTIAPVSMTSVAVPNLQGLSIADSTNVLLPLGLRFSLGQPTYSDSVPLNAVVSQEPSPGIAVTPGTTVRVSLSRGPSPFGSDSGQ